MYRKEVNAQNPLRILERSIHGGLGQGNLGVVMARAGVGKTAFLVQVGLDDAMRERPVLHLALGQTLDHVHAWYDALFADLAERTELEERDAVRLTLARHRVIQSYGERRLTPARLEQAADLYARHTDFTPSVVIIDGYDWERPQDQLRADVSAFKAFAKERDAELWMSARTHREVTQEHPTSVTPPCEECVELIDVAVFLEPEKDHVRVRLLKDHGEAQPPPTHLELHPDTMRLASKGEQPAVRLPTSAFTLLSGGAAGAEAEFGAEAERWGVPEVNFSFAGRTPERRKCVVELGEAELRQGDVSSVYVKSHLQRTFPGTPEFQKLLQTIWHQVVTAGEVFVVGEIQPDDTVEGGTGWAAELARHFKKPLHVFDQERGQWFTWRGEHWEAEDAPRIRRKRFTGTGSLELSDTGRAAIAQLFEDSFGDD